MSVRLRVAPSPTGAPHVGTAYVAIFNLAYARQQGGQFLLRIEDTDRVRSEAHYETQIFESLRWIGLSWDEGPDVGGPHGPYRQSERSELYLRHAKLLMDQGKAYPCFCTADELKTRKEARAGSSAQGYDRLCRGLSPDEARAKLDAGVPHVVRQAIPQEGEQTFEDLIRGEITIKHEQVDDQVLLKSDGFPTYPLANVVDDHLMGVTHVMRAEEWISSTPKHFLLYQAFGWEPPRFAHLPLLRNADKSKISKRKNPVSLKWYEEQGYLPEAMLNFLALMGFSMPDGREIFGFQDIVDNFSFDRIATGAPVFDLEKLAWLNGTYLRELPTDEVTRRLVAFGVPAAKLESIQDALPLVYERLRKLSDFDDVAGFFFADRIDVDPATMVPRKRTASETSPVLQQFADLVEKAPEWTKEGLEVEMRALTERLGWSARESFMAVRVALTGKTATLPLIESILVLGRERTALRLREASALLKDQAA